MQFLSYSLADQSQVIGVPKGCEEFVTDDAVSKNYDSVSRIVEKGAFVG